MSKLITVFGATGNQGGSVIKHILADAVLSKEFKIRGITRDTSKPAAQALAQKGVELKSANLDSKSSVVEAVAGSHTVFLVTNYWESKDAAKELSQGKNVADAAKEGGVSHIIFSSLLNVTETSRGRLTHVPHFDAKADIEQYIRGTGVPSTFVLPGYFMSNFTHMLRPKEDGSLTLAFPVSSQAKFPLLDAAGDYGKFVKAAIKHSASLNGKRVYAASDYYTPERILADVEEVTGKKTAYVQLTPEQYKAALPAATADEMLENHLFIEKPGYFNGEILKESLDLLDEKPTTWKEFITKSRAFH
ncbi:NmrA-like family domain-containing protein 1 [Staphylotrichum tortipilum]|uniref:NmrA-like family domain-containing protein 1 n=1 Tax=Staphylotrichum tortipilum TaxID=2831512 RepID=A0AAN6MLU8_9PEZI|nr:NmrA-like family domain-containing protein 1 [Staphylotrichum longicolle]